MTDPLRCQNSDMLPNPRAANRTTAAIMKFSSLFSSHSLSSAAKVLEFSTTATSARGMLSSLPA
jgi:hypothetical protein